MEQGLGEWGGQLRWARLVLLLVKPHYLMEQVGVCRLATAAGAMVPRRQGKFIQNTSSYDCS